MRDRNSARIATWRGRRGIVLAAACAFSALIAAIPGTGWASTGGLERVGTLKVALGDSLLADSPTRRILAVSGGEEPLSITTYDGDRLTKIQSGTLTAYRPQSGGSGKPRVLFLDERGRRLYVIAFSSAPEMDSAANPRLISIDVDSKNFAVASDVSLATLFPPGVRILGMTMQPSGRFLVVAQTLPGVRVPILFPVQAPRAAGVLITEIDPRSGTATLKPTLVRGCQSAISYFAPSEALSTGKAIFLGCGAAQLESISGPGVQAVAVVNRADPSDQELHFLPGAYARGDVFADAEAGRLLLIGSDPSSPAQSVWVFDAANRVFVGQVASGDLNVLGAGLNRQTGRLYVGIDRAVLVASDRGYAIPQAASFDIDANIGPLTAVPFNSTVVVPIRGPSSEWIFAVFRDTLPSDAFAPGSVPDFASLDRATTDTAQYSSGAQAFGVRIHRIGGANAALQNVFPFEGDYWGPAGIATGLKDGDRDVFLARIRRALLSHDESSAEAGGADRDANTSSDHETIRKASSGSVPAWPYQRAQCADFGGGSEPKSPDGAYTECSLRRSTTTARSLFERAVLPGVASIGSSAVEVTLTRDAAGILSGHAFAEVRNLVFAAGARIARVRSEVDTSASGTRGKADADYRRIFEGVETDTYHCPAACDPTEVARALSRQLGANVRVELPSALEVKTPGGAHGGAVRDPWERRQDIVINNEDETHFQVPALRVTFVNDRASASRLILDLAGTAAEATNLRVVPPPDSGGSPRIDRPPLPVPVPTFAPPAPPPPPPPAPGVVERVVRTLGHGWKVLLTGRPTMLVRSITLWMLFVSPFFFAVRRRVLRRLEGMAP